MFVRAQQMDSKTRSIDLARRIILELADSEARNKDGDGCVGKDEILKITNKRRLDDVTGPLEAMGLIETTKINIIWTGCRIGAFSFVPATARNAMVSGKNADDLAQFGYKGDFSAHTKVRIPDAPPKIPRKKKQDCEAKERLRFLLKRRALLNGELHEKELQIKRLGHLGVTYAEICNGVGYVIQQQL